MLPSNLEPKKVPKSSFLQEQRFVGRVPQKSFLRNQPFVGFHVNLQSIDSWGPTHLQRVDRHCAETTGQEPPCDPYSASMWCGGTCVFWLLGEATFGDSEFQKGHQQVNPGTYALGPRRVMRLLQRDASFQGVIQAGSDQLAIRMTSAQKAGPSGSFLYVSLLQTSINLHNLAWWKHKLIRFGRCSLFGLRSFGNLGHSNQLDMPDKSQVPGRGYFEGPLQQIRE